VIQPLRLDFAVACSPDHAFSTWGERFAQWWPSDHTATGAADSVVVLKPRGGRLYERTADGGEVDFGEVTVWEPPLRLGTAGRG
jgi:hypothetical protein